MLILGMIACRHIFAPPNAASAIGLTWCKHIPCYQAFVPGQTRWTPQLAEFSRQLQAHPDLYHLSLRPSLDGNILDTLVISLPISAHMTAGDIVQLYGVPCRVHILGYWNWTSLILAYPHLEAVVPLAQQSITPDTPVAQVVLYGSGSDPLLLKSNPCELAGLNTLQRATIVHRPWLGFTSIQHYLNYP
jgi:hypothetical protein